MAKLNWKTQVAHSNPLWDQEDGATSETAIYVLACIIRNGPEREVISDQEFIDDYDRSYYKDMLING